jgi:hypothetical protein
MKRLALALTLVAVTGTASAAIFVPPSKSRLEVTSKPEPKISAGVKSTAPVILARRAPVPFTPLPKPPAPQIVSLTEPAPDFSQIRPAPIPQPPPKESPTKAGRPESAKEVKSLSDTRCGGRPMTSIRVEPDGSVHVQC